MPDFRTAFTASSLTRQGLGHRQEDINCQDHAISKVCAQGVVLVVADGVSCYRHGKDFLHSHCEVGAWLAAELAATTALGGLQACMSHERIMDAVAQRLLAVFGPLWEQLGVEKGQEALQTTLLVGLVSEEGADVYASGDGSWGCLVPLRGPGDKPAVDGEALIDVRREHTVGYFGSQNLEWLGPTASMQARKSFADVRASFRLVLQARCPVMQLYVGTDGLRDEPRALVRLRRAPLRGPLVAHLDRPADCDDLGVAWTFRTRPSAFGELGDHLGGAEPASRGGTDA